MARFTSILTTTLLAAAAAATAAAQPSSISLYGTVQRVGSHTIAVWEPARHTSGEWIVGNAGAFRVGEQVRGTGTEDRYGHFYPRSVTIVAMPNNAITLSGTIQRVGSHTIAVWESARRTTGQWVVADADRLRVGEVVTGTGTEDRWGNFYPSNVTIAGMGSSGAPGSVTLSGTVQRVGTHTIAVWEPGRRTTGQWVVANAGRFRVGEHVTGTGTEDRRGDFYPSSVSVP